MTPHILPVSRCVQTIAPDRKTILNRQALVNKTLHTLTDEQVEANLQEELLRTELEVMLGGPGLQRDGLAIDQRKEIAVQNGSYFISVEYDGAGCQRAYGHAFKSHAVAVVVIGAKTGLVIARMVVQNYCGIHTRAERLGQPPPAHNCPRNFHSGAGRMEVHGLRLLARQHAARKIYWVVQLADGDTRAKAAIDEEQGIKSHKDDCCNHVVRLTSALLHKTKKALHLNGILTAKMITIMDSDLMCIFQWAHDTGDLEGAVAAAQNIVDHHCDLSNDPNLTPHQNCNSAWCTYKRLLEDGDDVNKYNPRAPPMQLDAAERQRLKANIAQYVNHDTIKGLAKCRRNNRCEGTFSSLARRSQGKMAALTRTDAWAARFDGVILDRSTGFHGLSKLLEALNIEPGALFKRNEERHDHERSYNAQRSKLPAVKQARRARRYKAAEQDETRGSRADQYGKGVASKKRRKPACCTICRKLGRGEIREHNARTCSWKEFNAVMELRRAGAGAAADGAGATVGGGMSVPRPVPPAGCRGRRGGCNPVAADVAAGCCGRRGAAGNVAGAAGDAAGAAGDAAGAAGAAVDAACAVDAMSDGSGTNDLSSQSESSAALDSEAVSSASGLDSSDSCSDGRSSASESSSESP